MVGGYNDEEKKKNSQTKGDAKGKASEWEAAATSESKDCASQKSKEEDAR